MTTSAPARAFGPTDPAGEIRRAIARLAMIPQTLLTATMAQVLQATVAEMDGAGAFELLDSSSARVRAAGLPQVCDRSGPRTAWTAALELARAVLDPRGEQPAGLEADAR